MDNANKFHNKIELNLLSEGDRNFGGRFKITKVIARTDWDRPSFKPHVEISGDLTKHWSDASTKMKTLWMIVEPDVLTHCLNVFQSDLNLKIAAFEKNLSDSQYQQIKAGISLIASRLALLIEADPHWREIVHLIDHSEDASFESAAELARVAREAIGRAILSVKDIDVRVDEDDAYGKTPEQVLQQVTEALISELKEFLHQFDIEFGAR
jgi:hypothetical protein